MSNGKNDGKIEDLSFNDNDNILTNNNFLNQSDKNQTAGGNIIPNPNTSLFRNHDYVVLTNEQTVDIHVCPLLENRSLVASNCNNGDIVPEYCRYRKSKCVTPYDFKLFTNKKINKQVSRKASLQTDIKATFSYYDKKNSLTKINVPTRGNSTKTSVTSLRPGSLSAPGKDVHVKHGSYQRRLLNLKKKVLNQ